MCISTGNFDFIFCLGIMHFLNLEIWPKWKILLKQFVSATPLKLLNRIFWNFVVMKDIMCSYAFLQEMLIWSFYAPLEKGGILFCNCRSVCRSVGRSVGRSVCRSVDQVLSGQYLLTPSLDQYQTWSRGCPQWVDDPYWFWGHMFKGQGQTTLLSPLCCPLNIFWPLHMIYNKLGAGVALNE